ncbi:Spy/CpxP family protein refolding chaperone [Simplicispira lacusdiani]|uniref:Spy/CpxP family protein refolding chaperone n=1 Tax=Simplicispira lacusdiani TaxID=2213010 RepID=UPI000E711771|nr:periplasmic heavy metal sensor [Simplicispira lacusdiani]
MIHRPWTPYLLAVSLALNLGVVAALVLRPAPPAPSAQTAPAPAIHLPDHLELSAEQRARWQALEPGFLQELAANWQAIRRHREALVRQIFAATPDRAAIDAEQAAIARLQGAQQQRVITQLLAERALLDERQRARLMELLLARYAQESTEEEQLHRD